MQNSKKIVVNPVVSIKFLLMICSISWNRSDWATGGLRVNSTSVKGGIISDPLFVCTGLKCKLWQSVGSNFLVHLKDIGKTKKNIRSYQTNPLSLEGLYTP